MPQTADTNRRVVLAERPIGVPDAKTLQLQHKAVPQPGAGLMLLRTRYLSLDPYMRVRMNDAKSYAEPVKLGEVMTGQVVAEVIQSNCDGYSVGEHVLAGSGWQDYALSDGTDLSNLGQGIELMAVNVATHHETRRATKKETRAVNLALAIFENANASP